MVGMNRTIRPQRAARRQRVAPAAISSAVPLVPADRATTTNTPSSSKPRTVDTSTAIRCSMWASGEDAEERQSVVHHVAGFGEAAPFVRRSQVDLRRHRLVLPAEGAPPRFEISSFGA